MSETTDATAKVWAQQRIWSRAAGKLKDGIVRARVLGLSLGVATAVLAVAAVQVGDAASSVGRVLSGAAAVTAGIATVIVHRSGADAVSSWTRARAASEGLKSEIYQRLAGSTKYTEGDPDLRLTKEAHSILSDVADLERYTLSVTPEEKPLPPVHNIDDYVSKRVDGQIYGHYRPRAATYERRVRKLRLAGDGLGALAVVLGAVATAVDMTELAAWVPVVTTVSAALLAHLAASRYDYQVVEYLRTAGQLEHLRDTRGLAAMTDPAFIDACEATISVENQAWMVRWQKADEPG